tara:strand:- start:2693 stop:3652 length:960 start_codon:yes stop_codon:yes gene_type:complete
MKILAIQNRMGIGDMVIFLPFIEAVSKKFKTPVSLLVKESSKASDYLQNTKYIDQIIPLLRNNKNLEHDGIIGFFKLANKLRKYKFDTVFIFNSSARFNLIAKVAGIKNIYQYPVFNKKNQHIIKTAQKFIKKELNIFVKPDPRIDVKKKQIALAKKKFKIKSGDKNILLGIGGSGPTKRIPASKFLDFMSFVLKKYKSRFFLATGKHPDEQKILREIINSKYKHKCQRLDHLSINKILPIISSCDISICNDSSFSHLSSALGVKTIVLMSDTPLIYGNYSKYMHAIIPDGEKTVTHKTLGKNKINSKKIFNKFIKLIN